MFFFFLTHKDITPQPISVASGKIDSEAHRRRGGQGRDRVRMEDSTQKPSSWLLFFKVAPGDHLDSQ